MGDVDTFEFVQNISSVISNEFAYNYLYCHLSGVDGYQYYIQQYDLYEEGGWLDWFQAFLQNLVGNILTINNLYSRVLVANDEGDTQMVLYICGRIFYFAAKFDPLEEGSLDASAGLSTVLQLLGAVFLAQ